MKIISKFFIYQMIRAIKKATPTDGFKFFRLKKSELLL